MAAIKTLFTLILVPLPQLKEQPVSHATTPTPEVSTGGNLRTTKTAGAPPTAASVAAAAAASWSENPA